MRQWTVLVFMAADNDLDRVALKDIHEMERIGSSDEVAVVVQVDRRGGGDEGAAQRGLVVKNPAWERYSPVVTSPLETIGETNTGDPNVLADFIVWGVKSFPAERYALVIWNHGSGWKPEFIYAAAEECAGSSMAVTMRAADFASMFVEQTRRCLFRTTLERKIDSFVHDTLLPHLSEVTAAADDPGDTADRDGLMDGIARAICLDETSHDAFDSKELASALRAARERLAGEGRGDLRFAFLGFDACLMAGIEVAYELRDEAEYIVGSEEIEPAVGWRYDLLLETLQRGGTPLSDEGCARAMVDNYIAGLAEYKVRLITQSAVRTGALHDLAAALNDLAVELAGKVDTSYGALAQAEKTATRFFDTDYLDIGDYLAKLERLAAPPELRAAWERASAAYRDAVLCSRFDFPREGQCPTGLSLYYPSKPMFDETYAILDVSRVMPGWMALVRRYHFLPEPH